MEENVQKEYREYVKQVTPAHSLIKQLLRAFLTGGAIGTIGQVILNRAAAMGMEKDAAGSLCSLLLVLISVILTGLNIYPSIVKWGGAGASVPLLGFGNTLWKGVKEGIESEGLLGIFKGGLTASSAGICGALVFGYLGALIFKPKMKD